MMEEMRQTWKEMDTNQLKKDFGNLTGTISIALVKCWCYPEVIDRLNEISRFHNLTDEVFKRIGPAINKNFPKQSKYYRIIEPRIYYSVAGTIVDLRQIEMEIKFEEKGDEGKPLQDFLEMYGDSPLLHDFFQEQRARRNRNTKLKTMIDRFKSFENNYPNECFNTTPNRLFKIRMFPTKCTITAPSGKKKLKFRNLSKEDLVFKIKVSDSAECKITPNLGSVNSNQQIILSIHQRNGKVGKYRLVLEFLQVNQKMENEEIKELFSNNSNVEIVSVEIEST
ncbi:unnamed protein product [Caenorhabditis angaria]|uniref:Major sperm protein n=1 Tax=Caenorhabditis angaria TaxID=860376 RepID=A0A9P1MY68_9PELO|nr:unnamed protein product [Caenorhabditis angaria]